MKAKVVSSAREVLASVFWLQNAFSLLRMLKALIPSIVSIMPIMLGSNERLSNPICPGKLTKWVLFHPQTSPAHNSLVSMTRSAMHPWLSHPHVLHNELVLLYSDSFFVRAIFSCGIETLEKNAPLIITILTPSSLELNVIYLIYYQFIFLFLLTSVKETRSVNQ